MTEPDVGRVSTDVPIVAQLLRPNSPHRKDSFFVLVFGGGLSVSLVTLTGRGSFVGMKYWRRSTGDELGVANGPAAAAVANAMMEAMVEKCILGVLLRRCADDESVDLAWVWY